MLLPMLPLELCIREYGLVIHVLMQETLNTNVPKTELSPQWQPGNAEVRWREETFLELVVLMITFNERDK